MYILIFLLVLSYQTLYLNAVAFGTRKAVEAEETVATLDEKHQNLIGGPKFAPKNNRGAQMGPKINQGGPGGPQAPPQN